MNYTVARLVHRQPRFFTGRYVGKGALPHPVTTGHPDKAHAYDDETVATLVCSFLNFIASVVAPANGRPWIVLAMPEARR
jgi:hypothetical protein